LFVRSVLFQTHALVKLFVGQRQNLLGRQSKVGARRIDVFEATRRVAWKRKKEKGRK
jgi:hypothetical protein